VLKIYIFGGRMGSVTVVAIPWLCRPGTTFHRKLIRAARSSKEGQAAGFSEGRTQGRSRDFDVGI
jgi:hypothetical protein